MKQSSNETLFELGVALFLNTCMSHTLSLSPNRLSLADHCLSLTDFHLNLSLHGNLNLELLYHSPKPHHCVSLP
ncbi:hypothetical protein HYC85_006795 [Camellia sinensis]|uniref:Uncharacterized protein n=1 Tax=Camellia sinensis TaxID=4442 RepID=A0A7J7HMH2_CAMSI|nr:hypothetical protein HYC85_006795 [Camellia sinensis]